MSLDNLTQHVELDRGMAHLAHLALVQQRRELLLRNPKAGQRWTTTEALSLKPLATIIKKIDKLVQRDKVPLKPPPRGRKRRPPKPHRLRIAYDELATVRFYYARLLASVAGDEAAHNVLAGVLGRFHQPSLNLDTHIRLAPATGPGCQTSLLS